MSFDVLRDIASFFSLLANTVKMLRYGIKSLGTRTFELPELMKEISNGQLEFGTRVIVNGTFSDFVPIARHLTLPVEGAMVPLDPLPCRPFPINGSYCASLQSYASKSAGSIDGFPIFYNEATRRPIVSLLSGLTVEIKGILMSIPAEWSQLLELKKPACLRADSIEITGVEKRYFGLIPWAIARLTTTPLHRGEGQIMHSKGFWSYNSMLTSDARFSMNGSGFSTRHGNLDEEWDTIREFRGVNLLNEEELKFHTRWLAAKAGNVLAQFDMQVLSPQQTKWLRRRIGI